MQYNLYIYIHSALHHQITAVFSGPPLRQLPRLSWPIAEAPFFRGTSLRKQSGKDCIIQRKNSRRAWYLKTNNNALWLFDTLIHFAMSWPMKIYDNNDGFV